MTLKDIFAYFRFISLETGWIWTELGRGMEWRKSDSTKFSATSLRGPKIN